MLRKSTLFSALLVLLLAAFPAYCQFYGDPYYVDPYLGSPYGGGLYGHPYSPARAAARGALVGGLLGGLAGGR
ncbi:hypothetical protein TELCIR_01616 [Teladorsagia circumcincta]|uniref:Uncharacterized protein n=1 Tax=Teladorsagia circumcincta TaxID=45464 RepID=A0A2G9V1F1_TELCI|nr:hypothetical protein TELCIR_01616 [Teladorsagia circumcincta]